MVTESWERITGLENLLILATDPGDDCLGCGGLIAQSCRRGRPPFVLVLTDGCASDAPEAVTMQIEKRTRKAANHLGLPSGRLLMAGLSKGQVPTAGRDFEAVARGLTMIMWARDCNVICAPSLGKVSPDRQAASRIAAAVAGNSGVGLLTYYLPPWKTVTDHAWTLDITPDVPAKSQALDDHQVGLVDPLPAHEVFSPIRPVSGMA